MLFANKRMSEYSLGTDDHAFRSLVRGKTVALVGPGRVASDLREEIRRCEVVYFIKPRSGAAANGVGRDPDIAYLQPRDLMQMASSGDLAGIHNRCLITTRFRTGANFHLDRPVRRLSARVPLPLREALAGTNVILDLVLAGVGSLRIYGIDLYSTLHRYSEDETRYRDARRRNLKARSASILRILFNQDLIGDFLYLQNLVRSSSRVEVRGSFAQTVAEGLGQYLDRLQESAAAAHRGS